MNPSRRSVSLTMSSKLVMGHVAVISVLSAARFSGSGRAVSGESRIQPPPLRLILTCGLRFRPVSSRAKASRISPCRAAMKRSASSGSLRAA